MRIKRRKAENAETLRGSGGDMWGDFAFVMRRTPEEIEFQKRYRPEWVKRGSFRSVINYRLQRLAGEYKFYFVGTWNLFDTKLQKQLEGTACMVDLHEAGDIGIGDLVKEMYEFCEAMKQAKRLEEAYIKSRSN
jgi:hypothetical protein